MSQPSGSTTAVQRRGRPPAGDSEETKLRVFATARQGFAQHGYAGASMRGIAAEAGVTGMAIYNYVDSKRALFEAVWHQTIDTIYADYADAVASASPALSDEIEAVLDRTYDLLLADPDHLRLAARLLLEREHADLAELDLGTGAHIDFLQDLGGRAVERGELTEVEAGQLSAFVLTLLWGITAMTGLDPAALDTALDAARWAIHNKIASAQEAPTT